MDARLKLSSGMIIVGPSQSGKTIWCTRLIHNSNEVFDRPVNKVYWCFGQWNNSLSDLKRDERVILHEGMPTSPTEIEPNSIVVIDDLLEGDFTNIFTKWTHHLSILAIKITQSLYFKPKDRTTNLNAQYLVIFKYPGDKETENTGTADEEAMAGRCI